MSRNADRGGHWKELRAQTKDLNALLRRHRDMLVDLNGGGL